MGNIRIYNIRRGNKILKFNCKKLLIIKIMQYLYTQVRLKGVIIKMKKKIYILIQCTWGIPQTLLGFLIFLINIKNKHFFYHGAIITERNVPSSVSLGMFVFTTTNPMKDKRIVNRIPDEELSQRLLVHEYGHTI